MAVPINPSPTHATITQGWPGAGVSGYMIQTSGVAAQTTPLPGALPATATAPTMTIHAPAKAVPTTMT